MRFEDRFTERAKNVLDLAQAAASELGHGYVGSEHILLGLAREGGGVAAKVLRESGLEDRLVLDLIEKNIGRGGAGRIPAPGPDTPAQSGLSSWRSPKPTGSGTTTSARSTS